MELPLAKGNSLINQTGNPQKPTLAAANSQRRECLGPAQGLNSVIG